MGNWVSGPAPLFAAAAIGSALGDRGKANVMRLPSRATTIATIAASALSRQTARASLAPLTCVPVVPA